jgi:Mg2+/Co2+ transporter CorC
MEELTDNAEEHDEEGSKQSEQKLGKLQYKVRRKTSINRYQVVTNHSFHSNSWNTISIPIV